MTTPAGITRTDQYRALTASTASFTACFAVWTIFSIIGLRIRTDLGLNDTEFGVLVATPVLTGSLTRLILGIWADQFGGRVVFTAVMIAAALSTWLLSTVTSYPMFLVAALGVGLAGGGFAVGTAYVSRWFEKERQGTALGIFGMGNVGSSVTAVVAPYLLVAFGWQGVARAYAVALAVIAVLFWLTTKDDPSVRARHTGAAHRSSLFQEIEPLRRLQVWRFALYYFFVFGAFMALALWLPRYYQGVYGLDVKMAGLLTALYTAPASLFRVLGGWMSDKFGARTVMYWTFIASVICTFVLSYPATDYVVHGIRGPIDFTIAIGVAPFTFLTFVLGFFMSLGKAAVYKHIPVYYPEHVGSVGGFVGLVGGLGGFFLPISFGAMNDLVGVWTACFMLLFGVVVVALAWMHFAILGLERTRLASLTGTDARFEPAIAQPDRNAPADGPRRHPRNTGNRRSAV